MKHLSLVTVWMKLPQLYESKPKLTYSTAHLPELCAHSGMTPHSYRSSPSQPLPTQFQDEEYADLGSDALEYCGRMGLTGPDYALFSNNAFG